MKKILKKALFVSALLGSVNCLALPAAAVDVATATSYMETTDDSKYPSSGTCASGATWTYDYPNRELHISGSTIRIDEMPQLPCRKIVFEKDFIPPENKFYEHTDLNTFVMSITLRSPNEIRQIYCYPNSPFAKEYEKIIATTDDDGSYADVLKCNYLPDDTGICGDVNLDGKVNLLDSVLLAKAVNGSVTVNDMQKKNMDCDGSGEIDIDDVTTLMQFLVHAVDSLPLNN
ncbi:dockerin type I repeat-containing protein [Ruminococcus sp.]